MKLFDRLRQMRQAYNAELHHQFALREQAEDLTVSSFAKAAMLRFKISESCKQCKAIDAEIEFILKKIKANGEGN